MVEFRVRKKRRERYGPRFRPIVNVEVDEVGVGNYQEHTKHRPKHRLKPIE
jgi:hypothetical protein